MTKTGQSAIAAGASGATTNTLDYKAKAGADATPLGYAASVVTGFGTGAGGSYLSSNVTSAVLERVHVTPRWPVPSGRHAWTPDHAIAPNVAFVNGAVKTGFDHAISGLQAGLNEAIRPEGESPWVAMRNGFLSGSEGPTAPLGRHAVP